jgi:hypothetical protein
MLNKLKIALRVKQSQAQRPEVLVSGTRGLSRQTKVGIPPGLRHKRTLRHGCLVAFFASSLILQRYYSYRFSKRVPDMGMNTEQGDARLERQPFPCLGRAAACPDPRIGRVTSLTPAGL